MQYWTPRGTLQMRCCIWICQNHTSSSDLRHLQHLTDKSSISFHLDKLKIKFLFLIWWTWREIGEMHTSDVRVKPEISDGLGNKCIEDLEVNSCFHNRCEISRKRVGLKTLRDSRSPGRGLDWKPSGTVDIQEEGWTALPYIKGGRKLDLYVIKLAQSGFPELS